MEKVKRIRDVPVGVLIIVLSQFITYGIMYLAKFPNVWEMFAIVMGSIIASDMVTFGIKLIKGFDSAELDKQ